MASLNNQGGASALPTPDSWATLHQRFTAYWLLFQADDKWGPLYVATEDVSASYHYLRTASTEEKRAAWKEQYEEASAANEREMERHMPTIYMPLVAAADALFSHPAPDVEAVRFKHELMLMEFDLGRDTVELFDVIRADIKRLTGIEA
jgi:hypothetical protein